MRFFTREHLDFESFFRHNVSPLHGIGGVGVWCFVCVHVLCFMSWNNVDIYKTTNRDSAKYFAGKKGDSTNALNRERKWSKRDGKRNENEFKRRTS
jgi:hypothetical protein